MNFVIFVDAVPSLLYPIIGVCQMQNFEQDVHLAKKKLFMSYKKSGIIKGHKGSN
jgi:hypothetical protein